jgi:hypothetical protein
VFDLQRRTIRLGRRKEKCGNDVIVCDHITAFQKAFIDFSFLTRTVDEGTFTIHHRCFLIKRILTEK